MDNTASISWVVSHLKYLWPPLLILLGILWKLVRFAFKAGQMALIVMKRILDGEDTIHKIATNHLPHLQVEMEKSNELLQEISFNISKLAQKSSE